MDHRHDLSLGEPPRVGHIGVDDLVDDLQLEEVVAGAEAADLRVSARDRLLRDGVGAGAGDAALVLGVGDVVLGRVAALDQPGHALLDHTLQLPRRRAQHAAVVGALGDAAHQLVQQVSRSAGATSSRPSPVRTSRTPQLMSKPTPPGETTPSAALIAATPPIGKP